MTNPASQQPAPIPEDKYDLAGKRATELHIPEEWRTDYIAIQVALWGSPNSSGSYPMERALAAMECCARIEAALTALRDFMWSEGYADQTAVMRQADAALGTPGREKP